MKKIHEGCLAIYVGNPNDERIPDGRANTGKLLRVGKPLGLINLPENSFYWEVDQEIFYGDMFGNIFTEKVAPEQCLQPLDNDDSTETTEDKSELLETTP